MPSKTLPCEFSITEDSYSCYLESGNPSSLHLPPIASPHCIELHSVMGDKQHTSASPHQHKGVSDRSHSIHYRCESFNSVIL